MLIELTEHKKHMKEHKKEKKQLQDELMVLQQTIREHQLPVIILFEGWSFYGVIGICSPKREKCLFWIAVGIRTFRHTHF